MQSLQTPLVAPDGTTVIVVTERFDDESAQEWYNRHSNAVTEMKDILGL